MKAYLRHHKNVKFVMSQNQAPQLVASYPYSAQSLNFVTHFFHHRNKEHDVICLLCPI